MLTVRTALVATTAAVTGLFAGVICQSSAESTHQMQPSARLLRIADDSTPDGTETQDPEQEEQQQENQQECGNPSGCG